MVKIRRSTVRAQSIFIEYLCKVQFCQKRVSFCATNSSLTVKCQCYPRGSNKSILIPPSVKKYVIFTINSLVRFAHSFVYLVKMKYFFLWSGLKSFYFRNSGNNDTFNLLAKRATFTFWVDKSSWKMPKMVHFGEIFENLKLAVKQCYQTWYSNPSKYTSLRAAEKVVHFEFVYIEIEYT